MRLVRPVASLALALSLFVTACGLDFDRFEPNDASSTDAPGSPGADASADAPARGVSADAPFEASSGDAATGQDAPSQSDAPATGDSGAVRRAGTAMLRRIDGVQRRRLLLRRRVRGPGRISEIERQRVHRRHDHRLRRRGHSPACQDDGCSGKRCCVDGACIQMGQSCGAALGTCGNNSACATCGGDGQTCCTGAPGGQGVAANFCTTSGEALQSRHEQVHGLRRKRAAVLRRGLVRRDRRAASRPRRRASRAGARAAVARERAERGARAVPAAASERRAARAASAAPRRSRV